MFSRSVESLKVMKTDRYKENAGLFLHKWEQKKPFPEEWLQLPIYLTLTYSSTL